MTSLSTDLSAIAFPLKRIRPLAEAAAEGGPRFAGALSPPRSLASAKRGRRGESAYGGKISICAAASICLSAFTNAPAGTIGGVTEDWTRWQKVAGLPAAHRSIGVGALSNYLYAIGGPDSGQINTYRFDGTNWMQVAGLLHNT